MYSRENFGFMRTELESGWFAIQIVADDKDDYGKKKLTKVCGPRNMAPMISLIHLTAIMPK